MATVNSLCLAISSPRSQVSERRRVAGSLRTCLLNAATTTAVSLPRHLDQHEKTGMPLHERCNVAVLSTAQQIAFPMTRDSAVFHFSRPFPNRDGIDDLTARVLEDTRVPRAAHAPLRSQVVHQLFFQYSTSLDEQAAVNGLVGHAHALVFGILGLQPPGNLLGRPFQDQFTRNDVPQLPIAWLTGSASAATPIPRLGNRHHERDRQDGHHGG